MAKVTFRRGKSSDLESMALKDGVLSFTTDEKKIYLDYKKDDGNLERIAFYPGKLTFGDYVFDGTEDVSVNIFSGQVSTDRT